MWIGRPAYEVPRGVMKLFGIEPRRTTRTAAPTKKSIHMDNAVDTTSRPNERKGCIKIGKKGLITEKA